jgi:hypothetical protein
MSDDELEGQLRYAAELLDPVPERLLRDATAAFTWRTVDAELASLVFDSVDAGAIRGARDTRLFIFEGTRGSAEVEVSVDPAGGRRLVGRVDPVRPARIECRCGEQQTSTTADELGRFTLTAPPTGPFRLLCQFEDGTLVTEWVSA